MEFGPDTDPQHDPISDRYNVFIFPHRAFRRLWFTVVGKIDTTDFRNINEARAIVPLTVMACEAYEEHNRMETKFFLNDLEVYEPTSCGRWREEHVNHIEDLKKYREEVKRISEIQNDDERVRAGALFSDVMHIFLALDLQHMHYEEREVSAMLNEHFTDEQLEEKENALVKSLDPGFVRCLAPFFILGGDLKTIVFFSNIVYMQTAKAPPQAWTDFCATVKSILTSSRYKEVVDRFPALKGTRMPEGHREVFKSA